MYVSNWTFRPAPGKHAEVIENSKKMAEFWKKYGANECHLMNLQGADVGSMSFVAMFDNAEGYGKANDALVADPEVQAILATVTSSGDWVRHKLARAIF